MSNAERYDVVSDKPMSEETVPISCKVLHKPNGAPMSEDMWQLVALEDVLQPPVRKRSHGGDDA